MTHVTYSRFQQIWLKRGKTGDEIEEWWIFWHDIEEDAGEWDDPQRFEILDRYVVDIQVCESAFNDSK